MNGILLEDKKAIYFYIPKVACTSLKTICANHLEIKIKKNVHAVKFPTIDKNNLENYTDYFKFAFVRNPFDRIVSCYKNKIRPKSYNKGFFRKGVEQDVLGIYEDLFYGEMPFKEFVNSIASIPDEKADDHFKSQYLQIGDSNGNLFVDFLGRFESLEKDFRNICYKIKLNETFLPNLNKTGMREGYQSYYTHQTKGIIENRYSKDLDIFKYSFDQFYSHASRPNLK